MKRRDAIKTIGLLAGTASFARLLPACTGDELGDVSQLASDYPTNFEALSHSTGWRTTWTHIVPGRFVTTSPYTSLLLYEQPTGYAELWTTDGAGRLQTRVRTYAPLGGAPYVGWTHLVPGTFGPSGRTGLLLYAAGQGRFYDFDATGALQLLKSYTGWRTNWTQLVPGLFTESEFTSVLFYSQADGYAELWSTDGAGNMTLAEPPHTDWRQTWTHIVAGDFCNDPDTYVDSAPVVSDLFFYEGATGYGEMFRREYIPATQTTRLVPQVKATIQLAAGSATDVFAGNFGGFGSADLAFYNRTSGQVRFFGFRAIPDTDAKDMVPLDTQTIAAGADVVLPGAFHLEAPDDHWLNEGPATSLEANRSWRAAPGAFSSLLAYTRSAGTVDAYRHGPIPPPRTVTIDGAEVFVEPVAGYVSSKSAHAGGLRATGSVLPGETISLHVSSHGVRYTIDILRTGPTQMMAQVAGLPANPPAHAVPRNAWKDGAQWPAVATFTIPAGWSSGLYVARVTTHPSAPAPAATVDLPFVVRRATPGSQSKILVVLTDTTYEAYNDWGGRSAYGYIADCDLETPTPPRDNGCGVPTERKPQPRMVTSFPQFMSRIPYAFEMSFRRPYLGRYDKRYGKWTQWEVPLLDWLARQGIAYEVCTSRDLHYDAPSATAHRLLVFPGHHEYWSREMRNHAQGFVAAGGNLAFFSGNTCWWQIRFGADLGGTEGDRMICYKTGEFDPVAGTSLFAWTTTNWHVLGEPETALTGVSYFANGSEFLPPCDGDYITWDPNHWVFTAAGLGLQSRFGKYGPGNAFTVVGSEVDRIQNNSTMISPTNFRRLASVYARMQPSMQTCTPGSPTNPPCTEMGTMGVLEPATAASGTVFTASTINWSLGLTRDASWTAVDQITLNVLTGLRGRLVTVSGLGNDISVGADGTVWAVSNATSSGGFSLLRRSGASWQSIAGGAVRIAVDPAGDPWVIDNTQAIFRRSGSTWLPVPGNGRDVGIGANGDVWIVGGSPVAGGYGIWKWTGSSWALADGGAVRIAVDPGGDPWIVESGGTIRRRTGGLGGSWQTIPGAANDIGIGADGSVWVIGAGTESGGFQIWRWVGARWARVPGAALHVAGGPSGTAWVVDNAHAIKSWS